MKKKCLVFGCTNCEGEGLFIGDLCLPCHNMLTTGKIEGSGTFIHDLKEKNEILNNLIEDTLIEDSYASGDI
jgi:hypothetical protein